MAEDSGAGKGQEPPRAKVVLVGIKAEKDRYEVIKVLAKQLGLSFDEAGNLMKELPIELIPSIPEEAGEQFAEKLRDVGADVEVLPITRLSRFCSTHPHRRARARCKEPGCDKYICEICITEANGKLLCPECYKRYKRRRLLIGLASLAAVFLVIWSWFTFGQTVKRWYKHMFLDTNHVAIILTSRESSEATAQYFDWAITPTYDGEYQGGQHHSLKDLEGWFQKEFETITGGDFSAVKLHIYGLYDLSGEVPKPIESDNPSYSAFQANRAYRRFFKDLLEINKVDIGPYDYILFVELARDTGVDQDWIEELGLVHEDFGFIKLPLEGRKSSDYYVTAVAHYIARLMGATSKINNTGRPVFPEGYAEPGKEPRFPQTKAELLGCYIQLNDFQPGPQAVNSLDDVMIGPQSAFEMGWLSAKQRDQAYAGVPKE